MAKHRSRSIAFKRQVAQEFLAGETLQGLAKRHDLARHLIRIRVRKYEGGAMAVTGALAYLQAFSRRGEIQRLRPVATKSP